MNEQKSFEVLENENQTLDDFFRRCFRDEKENSCVENKELKKELVEFCLRILKNTSNDKESIENFSVKVSGFSQYKFDDELDEIFEVANYLEYPHLMKSNVFELFEKMEKLLNEYIMKK